MQTDTPRDFAGLQRKGIGIRINANKEEACAKRHEEAEMDGARSREGEAYCRVR